MRKILLALLLLCPLLAAQQAIISGPLVKEMLYDYAVIEWNTSAPADSTVYYYEMSAGEPWNNISSEGMVKEHSIRLEGLSPGTGYAFKVESCAGGECVESAAHGLVTDYLPGTEPTALPPQPLGTPPELGEGELLMVGLAGFVFVMACLMVLFRLSEARKRG